MKNNIFNFRRFGKYFVSDIRTCSANFGLSLLVTCLSATLIVYALSIFGKLIISHIWEGPGLTIRLAAFLVMFVVIIINGPSKCYGRISEKKYGSFWLTLPASKLEKFLSMILLSAIIIPIAASALFLGIDAIICALDQSCGQSVAQNLGTIASNVINFNISESIGEQIPAEVTRFIAQLDCPWLYVDDFIGMTLPFLLGALVFRRNKAAKTILAWIIISMAVSIAATPFMAIWGRNLMETIQIADTTGEITELFNSWTFRNIALVDTINDTIVNLALMTGIYFRIKTIKH